jgi:4-hydroxybenzoate polyprenyltransferase
MNQKSPVILPISHSLWAYFQLMRPANIVTAWADILAGVATSGSLNPTNFNLVSVTCLLLATTGLYGGGVVFNDVFDAELDAKERPERPIPSGRASQQGAILIGSLLLGVGIVAAFQVSSLSGILAFCIAFTALFYDAIGKHNSVFGPINMGICRGINLFLGISMTPIILERSWFLALIPIVYIAAVTTLSRGEVNGGKSSTGMIAVILILAVIATLLGLGYLQNYQILAALPLVILFATRVLLPFIKATGEPTAENIRVAVRSGVLSLIILDATLAAGFGNFLYGLLVLSLLPFSMFLAQIFAVT